MFLGHPVDAALEGTMELKFSFEGLSNMMEVMKSQLAASEVSEGNFILLQICYF